MTNEKRFHPASAYLYLVLALLLLAATVFTFSRIPVLPDIKVWLAAGGIFMSLALITMLFGFFIVDPNESRVLVLFGTYKGTVKENGFFWANPFMSKKMVSLRARNLNSEKIKVNDRMGNPIEIATVIVWQVEETAKAVFQVDDYRTYVNVQSEAAIRTLAGKYSYDNIEDEEADVTLRGGTDKVNHELEKELHDRLSLAGIKVIEARISHLAYAPEIANAMLRRQQAAAVVSARFKIVEGAVSMVEMALEQLAAKKMMVLDEERKAAMVSNLMVVLCGDKDVSPVVNTGTLNH